MQTLSAGDAMRCDAEETDHLLLDLLTQSRLLHPMGASERIWCKRMGHGRAGSFKLRNRTDSPAIRREHLVTPISPWTGSIVS